MLRQAEESTFHLPQELVREEWLLTKMPKGSHFASAFDEPSVAKYESRPDRDGVKVEHVSLSNGP